MNRDKTSNYHRARYIVKEENYEKFDRLLATQLSTTFGCEINAKQLNEELANKMKSYEDTELLVNKLQNCISETCKGSFRSMGKAVKHSGKSVPWWTPELTVLRKKVNALRRRYQRTQNNEQLRQDRKIKYLEGSRQY